MDLIAVAVVFVLLVWLYKRLTNDEDSLISQGIAGPRNIPFIGNLVSFLTHKEGGMGYIRDLYTRFKDKK
jgi:hypothetical protein